MSITAQNKNTLEQTATTVSDKLEGMQRTITTVLEAIRAENRQQLDNINRTVNERLEKSISQQLSRSHQQIFANLQTMTEKITQLNTIGTDITKLNRTLSNVKRRGIFGETQLFSIVEDTNLQTMTEKITQLNTIGTDITKLNRTLSNVKRRGIFGETQLFSIVEDILPAEQYQKNFRTSDSSNEVVECAVKLPSDDENELYMPIDAKFPQDKYTALVDARESLEQESISVAERELKSAIISSASELYMPIDAKFPQDKYTALVDARESLEQESISVAERELKSAIISSAREICKYLGKSVAGRDKNARTTDYGIMFLPTESLYAEALSLDAVNVAQRDYKIYIVGPTNLSALLTVFKTAHQSLALQEKTREVEKILSDTKAEFEKFSGVLDKVKKGMDNAQIFKTAHQSLALQEKTREVEKILSDTKAEFEKFSGVLDKVKKGMDNAQKHLDTLIGTRTNTIRRALRNITTAQSQFAAPTLDQLALLDELDEE